MAKHRQHHKLKRVIQVRSEKKPRFIDRATYFAAIAEPLLTLPQAIQVYSSRSAADINITSWLGFEIMALVWIWYAIVHKERVVLVYQALFFYHRRLRACWSNYLRRQVDLTRGYLCLSCG